MADEPVTTEKVEPAAADNQPVVVEPSTAETTTASDGHLPINNASEPTPTQSTDETSPPAAPTPESPIMVTESEVSAPATAVPVSTPPAPIEQASNGLADEVESLSGEIQALEAKIDRLTGNVKPVGDGAAPEASTDKKSAPDKEPKMEAAPPPEDKTMPESKSTSKTVAVNDIYSRPPQADEAPKASSMPEGADVAKEVSSGFSLEVVGEVLSAIGIILFIAMTAFPFYKSFLSSDILAIVKAVGWPTVVVSLFIGFVLSLLGKGKVLSKIFTIILLVSSAVVYMGVAGYQNYLGPLAPMLDSVFSFYR